MSPIFCLNGKKLHDVRYITASTLQFTNVTCRCLSVSSALFYALCKWTPHRLIWSRQNYGTGRYVLQEAQQLVHNTYNIEGCDISLRISIYYTEISDAIKQIRYKFYV